MELLQKYKTYRKMEDFDLARVSKTARPLCERIISVREQDFQAYEIQEYFFLRSTLCTF